MRHTFTRQLTGRAATAATAHLTRRALLVVTGLLAGAAQAAIVYSSTPVQFGTNQTLTLGNQAVGPTLANKSEITEVYQTIYLPSGNEFVPVGHNYAASFNFTSKLTGKFTETARKIGDVIDLNAGFSPKPLASYSAPFSAGSIEDHPSSGLYGFKFRGAPVSGTPWMFGWMDLTIGIDLDTDDERAYHVTINRFAYDDSGASIAVGVTAGLPAEEIKPVDEPAQPSGAQNPAAAVPEPGSIALLALALGALGWTRRR